MADSLVVGEQIELIGAVASTNPLCTGAVFWLQPGYDLGADQPVTSAVGSLLLDGSRPFGYQSGNRTITLPIEISVPGDQGTPAGFNTLTAAREVLLREVNQQTWTLRWTRDPGTGTALPLLFDCFRVKSQTWQWGNVDSLNRFPIGLVTLTFEALPYARSDLPVVVDFPLPLAGRSAPPPPVTIDSFSSVAGTQWAANAQSPVGTQSAFWDPSASPGNNPAGTGLAAAYTKGSLALNLSQGWTGVAQSSASTTQIAVTTSDAAKIAVGDQFQLGGSFLGGNNAGFEGGVGNWVPVPSTGNCAIAITGAQFFAGAESLGLTSTAAGTMSAQSSAPGAPTAGTMAVLPGDNCWASAWFRSAVSVRGCQVGIAFYDVNWNFLSTGFGSGAAVNDSTSAWTQVTTVIGVIAPAGSAWAVAVAQVNSTGAGGELHYVDNVFMVGRGSGSALLQTQIFTVTSVTPPSVGVVGVNFTPAAGAITAQPEVAIQTAPSAVNSLVFWAGFGSTLYYKNWARLGGRVNFAVTLTDTYGTALSFSKPVKCTGSNQSGRPRWHKIRIPVPYNPLFDYANVASYTVTTTNRGGGDLRYTQLYLSALQATPPPVVSPTVPVQRGAVFDLSGLPGSARAPVSVQCQQTGTSTAASWFTRQGTYYWLAPPGVTTVSVFAVGAGGCGGPGAGANGAGGGGAGGSAANGAVAVTPGNIYKVVVGAGGHFVSVVPIAATASSFAGDSVTVTANPGANNLGVGAGAAGGAAGTGGFAGGTGGAGVAGASGGGGGGGSSGGSAAGGNTGGAASGSTGGAGGAAVFFGGAGGRGGTFGHGNGLMPAGNGGGGGGSPANPVAPFLPGADGAVVFTYTVPKTFQSLVIHRPPVTAPESVSPVQAVSIGDPADGTVAYTLGALHAPGLNAQFGDTDGQPSTYTIAVVANSWASPASARTITVTITQVEQVGGATYTATVAASITPNSLPTLSDTAAGQGPIVVLGELTLPIQALAQDNTQCYFTASITSGQTTDSFSDILFLHTRGSTVIIESPTGYSNYYLDEAGPAQDLGLVMGSLFDRQDAISILDRATIAGGPLSLDPDGNPWLLVYAAEGAPQTQLHYFARWHLDRYQ